MSTIDIISYVLWFLGLGIFALLAAVVAFLIYVAIRSRRKMVLLTTLPPAEQQKHFLTAPIQIQQKQNFASRNDIPHSEVELLACVEQLTASERFLMTNFYIELGDKRKQYGIVEFEFIYDAEKNQLQLAYDDSGNHLFIFGQAAAEQPAQLQLYDHEID
ncbi:MAG: hypothetical protein RRY34_07205, partial [Victivallaceae bacterium]